MSTLNKYIPIFGVAASILAIIFAIGYFAKDTPISDRYDGWIGGVGNLLLEDYDPYARQNGGLRTELGLSVGSTTPKQIINISAGTCNLSTGDSSVAAHSGGSPGTFAASTTKMHFCSAPGVRIGDQVFVTLPSGIANQSSSSPLAGPALLGGFSVAGAFATTSDIIGVALYNSMAVATGSYSQATTGVRYLIFR